MTPENFCYWLQGYFEITDLIDSNQEFSITPEQCNIIKKHLQLVFTKVTNNSINFNNLPMSIDDNGFELHVK